MATLPGYNVLSPTDTDVNPNISAELSEYAVDYWPPSESLATALAPDGYVDNLPVSQPELALVGAFAHRYLLDYYFRVHIVPGVLRLGALTAAQTREVEVWSAHFVSNNLTAIDETDTTGLILTAPADPPTLFGPLESRLYELQVDTSGPAVVDALYVFVFALDPEPSLQVLGERVIAWPFGPDWNAPVLERLEWLTDVLSAHSAKEQRARLRTDPRFGWEYRILFDERDRVLLENLLEAWQARIFGLPLWPQASVLTAVLSAGSTTIPGVDTATSDYEANGIAAIVRGTGAELVEIESVGGGSLTLKNGTVAEWPVGAKVLPVRLARIANDLGLAFLSDGILAGTVRFAGEGEFSITPAAESADYQGIPVFLTRTDWALEVATQHARAIDEVDFETGLRGIDDRAGVPSLSRAHAWLLDGRQAVKDFRAFLAARAGRLIPFWLPSHQRDVVLLSTIGSGDTSMQVENRDYARLLDSAPVGRRDVMIWLHDGTRFYRRLTGATETSPSVELLSFTPSLGQNVTVAEVRMISFMRLVRFSADAVELAHETDAIARVQASLTSIRDDVP